MANDFPANLEWTPIRETSNHHDILGTSLIWMLHPVVPQLSDCVFEFWFGEYYHCIQGLNRLPRVCVL